MLSLRLPGSGIKISSFTCPAFSVGSHPDKLSCAATTTSILPSGARRAVHARLFQYGYVINFLNCGSRLDALQEQLGHKDINTTRIYLRLSDEDVKREVAKIQF